MYSFEKQKELTLHKRKYIKKIMNLSHFKSTSSSVLYPPFKEKKSWTLQLCQFRKSLSPFMKGGPTTVNVMIVLIMEIFYFGM